MEASRNARAGPRGLAVGINLWPTFGSGSDFEKSPLRPPLPFPPMVSIDGPGKDSIACPISPEFLAYTRREVHDRRQGGPGLHLGGRRHPLHPLGGVPYPCFCERCVKVRAGALRRREELADALNAPENRDAADGLVVLRRGPPGPVLRRGPGRRGCGRSRHRPAVHDGRPDPHHLRGRLHREMHGGPPSRRGRPGHGFYWDDRPEGMLHKAMEVGRQTVRYPGTRRRRALRGGELPLRVPGQGRPDPGERGVAGAGRRMHRRRLQPSPLRLPAGRAPRCSPPTARKSIAPETRPAWARTSNSPGYCPGRASGRPDAFLMAGMDCVYRLVQGNNPDYAVDEPEEAGRWGFRLPPTSGPPAEPPGGQGDRNAAGRRAARLFSKGVWMDADALKSSRPAASSARRASAGDPRMFARESADRSSFQRPVCRVRALRHFDPAYDLHPLAAAGGPGGLGGCLRCDVRPLHDRVRERAGRQGRGVRLLALALLGHPYKLWQLRACPNG